MNKSQEFLSNIIVHNKYAKYLKEKSRRETWSEIVERNKAMHYSKFLASPYKLSSEDIGTLDWVFSMVHDRKVLPSMRSMQFAGRSSELNNIRLYNCSYLPVEDWKAFHEIMFLLLSGTGVGFSIQKHHIEKLPEIRIPTKERRYLIGDSSEGWADAVRALMKSYFGLSGSRPLFDFRAIREKGQDLITSGGKAPGPEPIQECLFQIEKILKRKNNGDKLTSLEVYDIVCHIADAVLSGGIRRAALISLFSVDDEDMLYCKTGHWWETNPQRGRSNNSAVFVRHKVTREKFDQIWKVVQAAGSGEPGIFFTNDKDMGTNPCGEISLRPYQFCNLTEVNISDVKTQEELNGRVRAAAILGTLQATYTNFHYLRDIWKTTTEKDALIGVGLTGVASNHVNELNFREAAEEVRKVNKEWAKKLGIKPAARLTTIKPSGTASLVLGTSSGIHPWHSKYYKRRFRLGKTEELYHYLLKVSPELVEDDVTKPHIQAVVSIPQKAPEGAITREEPVLDFLERIKKFNVEWIRAGYNKGANNNNVSATVSIKPEEWDLVGNWMWENREFFNGLSVLPFSDHTYVQAPFEDITEEEYNRLKNLITVVNLDNMAESQDTIDLQGEAACSSGACEVTFL